MKLLDALSLSAIVIAVMSIVWHQFGRLEGTLFPVVTPAEITRTETVDQFRTRIWGTFEKRRECTLKGVAFERNGLFVPFVFEEGVEEAHGVFEFGPIVLGVPEGQLGNVTATVTHDCHPLWLTISTFLRG